MPSLTVKIEYDWPLDPNWLNGSNVTLALHAYYKNTKFEVTEVVPWALCEGEVSQPNTDEEIDPMDGTRRTDAVGQRLYGSRFEVTEETETLDSTKSLAAERERDLAFPFEPASRGRGKLFKTGHQKALLR